MKRGKCRMNIQEDSLRLLFVMCRDPSGRSMSKREGNPPEGRY